MAFPIGIPVIVASILGVGMAGEARSATRKRGRLISDVLRLKERKEKLEEANSALEDNAASLSARQRELTQSLGDLEGEMAERRRKGMMEMEAAINAEKGALLRLEKSRKRLEDANSTLEENVASLSARERELLEALGNVEGEIAGQRAKATAEMEASVTAEKEIALNELSVWSEKEKDRLRQRFEREYKTEIVKLRTELSDRIHAEFDKIHEYFAEFAVGRKTVVEQDIREFLEKKRAAIVSDLG